MPSEAGARSAKEDEIKKVVVSLSSGLLMPGKRKEE
jgi:hypothetical protein